MLRVAAVTGARRAELAALRWTDLSGDVLTIDSAIGFVTSGDGHREFTDAATKTANARTVTLDPDTVVAIEALRREREQYGPWMFGLGPELVSPDRIGWWWKRARKLAGIDERWRLHDLRHWSATVAIGQGHDVRTVAGRLGHANPAMTLRVYAQAFAAADQAVAAALGDVLDRVPIARPSRTRRGTIERHGSARSPWYRSQALADFCRRNGLAASRFWARPARRLRSRERRRSARRVEPGRSPGCSGSRVWSWSWRRWSFTAAGWISGPPQKRVRKVWTSSPVLLVSISTHLALQPASAKLVENVATRRRRSLQRACLTTARASAGPGTIRRR